MDTIRLFEPSLSPEANGKPLNPISEFQTDGYKIPGASKKSHEGYPYQCRVRVSRPFTGRVR
jgi:hypothetical protein